MSRRGESTAIIAILLLGVVTAVVYTWPLALHSGSTLPYTVRADPERPVVGLVPGDHLQFYYFLAVTRDMALGKAPLFQDPYEFSAPEPSGRASFFFLPFSILFAAATILGEATAYNLLVWLSFPATALAVFALGRSLGLGYLPAAFAALAATIVPYRVANVAGGHPAGFVFFLLPLTFWFLERAWRRASLGASAGAGLVVTILAVNEPHFVYFLAFLLPAWLASALWRELPEGGRPGMDASVLAWLALAALGPAIAYATWRQRFAGGRIEATELILLTVGFVALLSLGWALGADLRSRADRGDGASEAVSYLPLAALSLYSVQALLDVPYLGRTLLVAVVLLLVVAKLPLLRSIVALMRDPRMESCRRRILALWPVGAGLVVAAGFLLQFKGAVESSAMAAGRSAFEVALFSPRPSDFLDRDHAVLTRLLYPGLVPVALAVVSLRTAAGRTLAVTASILGVLALGFGAPGWLPLYTLAYEAVPFFGMIRQPAKFFAVAFLALSLAAGFGAAWLGKALGERLGRALVVVAMVALAVDFSSTLPLGLSSLPAENQAYAAVAERGRGSNLLELPIWPGDSAFSSIYQYWATRTRVPMVNGYSPTAPRDYVARVARPLESMNLGELTADQHRLLDEIGVRLVTLHRDAFPPQVSAYPYRFTLASMRANPNLQELLSDDGVYLFERRPGDYRDWDGRVGSPLGVFYEAEELKIGSGKRVRSRAASGGAIVRGLPETGDGMPSVYGPYRPFPPGSYRAIFRARGRGRVEVTTDEGRRQIASAAVDREETSEVAVRFELARATTLELRAQAAGPLDLDWVLVEKLDAIEESGRLEAEDLIARSGAVREDGAASGRAVAVLVPEAAPAGSVVLDGPYRILDPGRRLARVSARGGAFRLRVESADGRRRLAVIGIPSSADWRTTEAEIEVPNREVVCTRVVSAGSFAEIDYIELRPGR